jgi:cytochrome c peroxidase
VAELAGVDLPNGIAWAAAALDYDNDSWQDLYLAVMTTTNHKGLAANPLFHNNGDGTFSRVSSGSGASDVGPTMGIATADFDNDGWVDLLIGNRANGYSLLRNQSGDQSNNHWFSLELVGSGPINRDAIGSRVTLRTADGATQTREVQSGSSLGAGNELTLHFGLGPARPEPAEGAVSITELTINWPDGRSQQFQNIPADRKVNLPYPLNAAAEAAQQTALYPVTTSQTEATANGLPTTNILIVVNVVAWLGLLLLVFRYRNRLGISRQSWRWAGALALVVVVSGYLFSNLQAAEKTPEPGQTTPTLNELLAQAGATVPLMLPPASEAKVELGRVLFWDPILSGNKDITCATCHHPTEATGDGLALPLGTGGQGLGLERVFVDYRQILVPRNAPPIFNFGLDGMDIFLWDGRVSGTAADEFDSPSNDDLPSGLENALAAQGMFPVLSREELRGQRGDADIFGERNPLASIDDHESPLVWAALMERLLAIPAYRQMFEAAYPDIPLEEMGFEHAANALAAFQMTLFTFVDSPWDRYLQGDETAVSPKVLIGAELFYGKAGCAQCHSGSLLSDMQFHNIGVPQMGPGKGDEEPLDFGRARETGNESDLFAFRTPPLRNVAVTGPWMHNGAYATLEAAVWHHVAPAQAVKNYDFSQLPPLVLAQDSGDTAVHTAALNAPSFVRPSPDLTDAEVAALLSFLESLTSSSALDLSYTIPESVPSGLPVGGSIH